MIDVNTAEARTALRWSIEDDEALEYLLVWRLVRQRAEAGGFNGVLLSDFTKARRTLRAMLDTGCPASSGSSTTERFEVVRMFNGTWNVRDTHTGEWVEDGVWGTKPAATARAASLNASSGSSTRPVTGTSGPTTSTRSSGNPGS